MNIADLATQSELLREQAAALLVEGFDEPRGWPTLELAREEVASLLRDGFARAVVDGRYSARLDWWFARVTLAAYGSCIRWSFAVSIGDEGWDARSWMHSRPRPAAAAL